MKVIQAWLVNLFVFTLAAYALPINGIPPVNTNPGVNPAPGPVRQPPTNVATPAAPSGSAQGLYALNPWSVPQSCVAFTNQQAIDHRTNPPSVTSEWVPTMAVCNKYDGNQTLHIVETNGQSWDGKQDADVYIVDTGLERCLQNSLPQQATTRPVSATPVWFPCTSSPGSYTGTSQTWHISRLANGATQVSSSVEFSTSIPSPQAECIELNGPSTVVIVPCSSLHNYWMLTPL